MKNKKDSFFDGWDQLKRYADDLSRLHKSTKKRDVEFERISRQLHLYAADLNMALADLRTAHTELRDAYLDTIQRLVLMAESRDDHTGQHIVRMGCYSANLARVLGLPARRVEQIRYAAPMHDIGKVGIPDPILKKTGRYSEADFKIMMDHPIIGARILEGSRSEILQLAREIVLTHHEKWDGSGYPRRLAGEAIPVPGRIVALADVYDALTSERPYKKAISPKEARQIIRAERGKHFDPNMVDVFCAKFPEVTETPCG